MPSQTPADGKTEDQKGYKGALDLLLLPLTEALFPLK